MSTKKVKSRKAPVSRRAKEKTSKKSLVKDWRFWAAVVGLLIIVGVAGQGTDKKETENSSGSTSESEVPEGLSEADISNYCQHPFLIQRFLNLEKINIIASPFKASQPSPQLSSGGAYDVDGNKIWVYSWKGWDKIAEEAITFWCYVSGPNSDSITLHWLRASEYYSGQDVDLYGSRNYPRYTRDGEKIEF